MLIEFPELPNRNYDRLSAERLIVKWKLDTDVFN
jgi:hypothetical protein